MKHGKKSKKMMAGGRAGMKKMQAGGRTGMEKKTKKMIGKAGKTDYP